ncbi:MAG TPA: M56 family metallopeptidase [Verrucomicrobiae bacterium]
MSAPWHMVGWLAVEVALVVVLSLLVTWRMRSVIWQRTLWQAGLIALTGVLVVEFAALTPVFARKEVRVDAPVVEVKPEVVESGTPFHAPIEITATELSVPVPTEPLPAVNLVEPVATAPRVEDLAVKVDTIAEVSAAKVEEQVDSARKFPLVLALVLLVWVVGTLVLGARLLVGRFLLLRFCARSRVVAGEGDGDWGRESKTGRRAPLTPSLSPPRGEGDEALRCSPQLLAIGGSARMRPSIFDRQLFERVQGIARKLGLKQSVQVLETGRIQTPVVFGLVRLTIALPSGFAEKFGRKQQEAILAHELAHLAARDPLWYLLADALVSVLWWHPLVWVARARLQVASEMAADEACVLAKHGPETLAECLVTIAQEMTGKGSLESIGIEGSGFRSRLGQRVERLLELSAEMVSRPAAWRTRMVKVGMPVLLVGVLLVGSGWVRRDQSAPWSGLISGAWNMMSGILKTEEADIRREPRPVLVVAQAEKSTVESDGRAEKALEPLVTKVFNLKIALPTEIVTAVGTAITDSRGKIVADDRAKKLLVSVVKGDMGNVEDVIAKLDVSGGKIEGAVQATNTAFSYDKDGKLSRHEGDIKRLDRMREVERERLDRMVEAEERESRLDGIRFSKVSLKNVTLEEAVKRLISSTPFKGLKVEMEGKMATTMGNIELGLVMCSAEIEHGDSLRQALDAVCKGAVYPLQYQYQSQGNKVVFQAKTVAKPVEAEVAALIQSGRVWYEQQRLAEAEIKFKEAIKFDPANTVAFYYLNLIQEARYGDLAKKRDEEQRARIVQVEKSWDIPAGTNRLPMPNPYVRTNGSQTMTKARQRKLALLDQMVMKEVFFDGWPLVEVVRILQEESVKLDPEKMGVNFIINSNLDDQPANRGLNTEGKSELKAQASPKAVDLEKMIIRINPALKNLRMIDALDAITKVATPIDGVGLTFMVEDYAVVFRQRVNEPKQLFTRIFKVDKEKLIKGLEAQTGQKLVPLTTNLTVASPTNLLQSPTASSGMVVTTNNSVARTQQLQTMARQFFAKCGVNVSSNESPETQIFFNDRTGALMVRASLLDLEIIASALEVLAAFPDTVASAAVSATSSTSAVWSYKFDGADYVMGVEKLTGKKVEEMSAVDLAAQVNGGRGMTNKHQVQWHQIELLTREFLKSQGADLSAGNFGLIAPQKPGDEAKWAVAWATAAELDVFRKSSQKIVEAGKLAEMVLLLGRATNQVTAKTVPPQTAAVTETIAVKEEISILVQDAKLLYELRRLDEAEKKLQEAIKRDPKNPAAYYYMNLVQEARNGELARKRDIAQRSDVVFPGGVPKARDGLPTPNPYVRTNSSLTITKARQRIEEKLDKMVVKEVFFDGLPLSEVVRYLRNESVKLDAEQLGINFMMNSRLDEQSGLQGNVGKNLTDPLGAPLAPAPAALDLSVVLVKINPPLKNLTMREMLNAITNVTAHVGKHGLDYKVEDYAVVFRERVIEPPQLFTRIFKVEPNTFNHGLQQVWASSGMPANSSTNLQDLWREFIRHAGVKTDTNSTPASQVFYNEKTGVLMVRASLRDLEVIQSAIEVLNMIPPQVQIEVRYIEVSDEVAKKMGLNWFTSGALSSTNSLKVAKLLNPTIPTGPNVRLEAPVLPNFVSVLSPKQTKDLIQKLLSGEGVDILTGPKVTTVSGRQAQISVLDQMKIEVGVKEEHKVATGPTLDIVPKVMPDGKALQMTWGVNLTQFVGYDKPAKGADKEVPLPRFRVRQVTNTSVLMDGQTLLIGCGTSEMKKGQQKGLFRSGPKTEIKHVVVMLTPRIIDPAGNFVNSDKELGY